MIHYHGTPCGGKREEVARFLTNRHALIPWVRDEDIGTAAEVCQTFMLDNGAFSAWKSGKPITNWKPYFQWVQQWVRHPAYSFCIIPDVIDGTEMENDVLIGRFVSFDGWRGQSWWASGVPVWHLHESLERLDRLVRGWERVALGSSGQWSTPGTDGWWNRIGEAMQVACDEHGRPRTKLHGLRMLDPAIVSRLPLASADSTNAVRNSSSFSRFGQYTPPNACTRMHVIANRIEQFHSPAVWKPQETQSMLLFSD